MGQINCIRTGSKAKAKKVANLTDNQGVDLAKDLQCYPVTSQRHETQSIQIEDTPFDTKTGQHQLTGGDYFSSQQVQPKQPKRPKYLKSLGQSLDQERDEGPHRNSRRKKQSFIQQGVKNNQPQNGGSDSDFRNLMSTQSSFSKNQALFQLDIIKANSLKVNNNLKTNNNLKIREPQTPTLNIQKTRARRNKNKTLIIDISFMETEGGGQNNNNYMNLKKQKNNCLDKKEPVDPIEKYRKGNLVCKSKFSNIYDLLNLETGETLILKSLTFSNDMIRNLCFLLVQSKVNLMKKGPINVIEYHEVINSAKDEIWLVQEKSSGGTLPELIQRYGVLTEKLCKKMMYQLLTSLNYFHKYLRRAHTNLTTNNLMIDQEGNLKFNDYYDIRIQNIIRLAKTQRQLVLSESQLAEIQEFCRSVQEKKQEYICEQLRNKSFNQFYYQPPEVLSSSVYEVEADPKTGEGGAVDNFEQKMMCADIWSLGCVLLEMLTGKIPFSEHAQNQEQLAALLEDRKSDLQGLFSSIAKFSQDCREFIADCLEIDSGRRKTAQQLLKSQFLKDYKE